MKKQFALLLFLFSTLTAASQEYNHWQLLYSNDENGKSLAGDINSLIKAVRNGEEIRIYWSSQRPNDPTIKVEHFADAKFLTILSDTVVFAQIDPIIGQSPSFKNQTISLKENLEWSMIAASNGKTDTMMRNVISGEILGHGIQGRAIKWYCKKSDQL